jgi:hypothetical protein
MAVVLFLTETSWKLLQEEDGICAVHYIVLLPPFLLCISKVRVKLSLCFN